MTSVNSQPTKICHLIALPFPGRGHINPMMNLCKSLVSKSPNILITFIVTEEWFDFIGSDPKPDQIRFGSIPNTIPSEIGRGKDSPSFFETVLAKMKSPVETFLDGLELPATVIIADTYLIWAVEVGNRRNIPVASFWTMSAAIYSIIHFFDLFVQNKHFPIDLEESGGEVVDYIPGVSPLRIADLPTCFYGYGKKVLHRAIEAISEASKAQYLLLTSIYELETNEINALKKSISLPIYQIGPAIPYFYNPGENSEPEYIQWLNRQPRNSVLYISQGSLHTAARDQMDEIKAALCETGVRFFWVSRGENFGMNKEFGEKGLIVKWCDQLRVLCHSSIGGFWSHCGWNSTNEALFAGIPMLTFPIYWDQVTNSKIIVDDLKIGWKVKRDGNLVGRDEIVRILREFMDLESDEGKEMRERVKKLKGVCENAIEKGGSTDIAIDSFINDITKC